VAKLLRTPPFNPASMILQMAALREWLWLLWDHTTGNADTFFAFVLCLFTAALTVSTIALWQATRAAAQRQSRDTEILQRAYVSVEPAGITTTTVGHPLAHVDFKNVGHLPASEFRWFLQLTPSNDENFSPPKIAEDKLRAAGVLPIGASIKRGSPDLLGVPSEKFLYAWGRVTYSDGFGNHRFTDFCHRYNTAVRETPPGGGYLIRNTHARHHDHGNAAD
jgi:hypothetical protein